MWLRRWSCWPRRGPLLPAGAGRSARGRAAEQLEGEALPPLLLFLLLLLLPLLLLLLPLLLLLLPLPLLLLLLVVVVVVVVVVVRSALRLCRRRRWMSE